MSRKKVAKTNKYAKTVANIIELNGNHYDAVTGKLLPKASSPTATPAIPKGQVIDGFVRNPTTPHIAVQPAPPTDTNAHITHAHTHADANTNTHNPTPAAKTTTATLHDSKPPKTGKPHPIKPAKPHQPQRATTLMRHAVKPPIVTKKPAIRTQQPMDMTTKVPSVVVVPKVSYLQADPRRTSRAGQVAKSRQIRHFSQFIEPVVTSPSTHPSAPATAHRQAPAEITTLHVPPPSHGRPVAHQTPRTMSALTAKPPLASTEKALVKSPAANDADVDIFERALAKATAHEHQPLKRTKTQNVRAHRRAISLSASVLVILLLSVFIGYQNKSNINLQLASAKAGFHATLPRYQPSGYAINHVSSSPGTVNVSYHAPSKDSINISQKTSNWDSQTLRDNYVASNNQPYTSYQNGGQTIYVYGNHQATWVSGGIWYQIQGNGQTTSRQLVEMAASM